VDVPLLKDETTGVVRAGKNGKTALTRYERLAANEELSLSLVSIELLTGRTHQARVHMAYAGYPILGDGKYGKIEANRRWRREAKRPLLHSFELGFPEIPAGPLVELSGKTFQAPPGPGALDPSWVWWGRE
jgi:23S rRNA pseudouridine955/2504/2580 synthase